MDQNRSNIAWLAAESKTLASCGKQAWEMVPKWHRGALGLASTLMAANSLANIFQALIVGWIIDMLKSGVDQANNNAAQAAAIQNQMMWDAGKLLGIIGVLYLMRETFNVLRRYMVENTCTGLNRDMQMRVAGHVMRYDMQQFNSQKLGTMHGRIIRSVDGLIQFIRLMFLDFMPAILTGVFALVAVILKEPIMGLVMLGVIPISVFLTLQQLKTQKGVRLQLMRDNEEVDGMLVEQMAGVEYIRVANTLDREAERLAITTDRRRKRELKHHFEMSLFGSGKAINEGLFNLLVLAVSTYLVIIGRLAAGDLFVFSALFLSVMTPLSEIHRIIDIGHESSLKMADLRELLDRPIDESFETPPIGNMAGITARAPEIEVIDASAIYRTGDRVRQVLHDVSFSVREGEVIGIAGQSGGGKSSMVKVLLRLLHPTHGTIKIHGVPIDLMDRASLANLVGYVGQNPFVFSGTIRDNIAYGCGEVSDQQVHQAAAAASIHDEILQMHDGYNTAVSERGTNLSGGQRQRLAIARLLLRNTPILILDEATSALDNISERSIQSSLGIRSGKQTILMIAHRLTTLRHCDKILVFDDGRIVESGTFENLSRAKGKFAELLQASESEIEAIAS
jgi:ATP-binding cassette subfamily B protein